MSDDTQGLLNQKLAGIITEYSNDLYDGMVTGEWIAAQVLDEAKAEIPTRADAEKVAKERMGRELRHDGFDVALIACIHAELFGKWANKWFGKP